MCACGTVGCPSPESVLSWRGLGGLSCCQGPGELLWDQAEARGIGSVCEQQDAQDIPVCQAGLGAAELSWQLKSWHGMRHP